MDYKAECERRLKENKIHVRKYSKSPTGRCFWDDTVIVPDVKTKLDLAVCFHEIGHYVKKHCHNHEPRWQEELDAWNYAKEEMVKSGIEVDAQIEQEVKRGLSYALCKAWNRGMKDVPEQLKAHLFSGVVEAATCKPDKMYMVKDELIASGPFGNPKCQGDRLRYNLV